MILRPYILQGASKPTIHKQCIRHLHKPIAAPPIPSPIPFIPDAPTFLTVIGRKLSQHSAKIPSWEALFSLTSPQLRELGVEPARSRRYLLHMRERFRNGLYGIGGDLTEVKDGVGELRVVEVPVPKAKAPAGLRLATASQTPFTKRLVVNVAPGEEAPNKPFEELRSVKGVTLKGLRTICGPHVKPIKGTKGLGAQIVVAEGIWEQKRGHKVDGGERRKAEVRAKRRSEERKNAKP
ncbi:hypothetical protein M501DRAFT_1027732 [Patellaria atrata CBS 101060]|uniref:Small ribosomal subunit protein mS41 n=1 Tax=Patellaria atrata CBS 101060 TaxID=1346257 RepID=A0A9P4SJB2_9PEZI|nr:hypothetical protein M501DRAFT_1027732 [Patellaria atrata CBS 101060]